MSEYNTDVVITGSGVAGATLANLLCRNGIRCIVIDAAKSVASHRSDIDPRALSITPASARILSSINIWQKLPEARVGYFRQMQVWDENSAGDIHFDAADICEPVIGYIVEQALIEQMLNEAMTFLPDFKRISEGRVESIITNNDKVIIQSSNGERINAQLLVAADGSNSPIRRLAGLAYARHDYEQQAVACVVSTALPHERIARQRFLGSGPLAFLPMADQHCSGIVWSTTPDHAQSLLALPDKAFCKKLQLAFESRLGEITSSGPRSAFKLFRAEAAQYTAERLAMVGDAAHSVHPLAGQGANMGLLDVAVLAQLILAAKKNKRSIASRMVLRRYERWRKGENYQMMMILDGLKYLFGQDNSLVRNLRGIGLNTVNSAPWVKNLIMKHAMGREGDLPTVVRQPFSIEMR